MASPAAHARESESPDRKSREAAERTMADDHGGHRADHRSDDHDDDVGGRDGSTPSPPPRLETLGGRLTTPVAHKADSIASQFQREILGELAATSQQLSLVDPPVAGTAAASGNLLLRLLAVGVNWWMVLLVCKVDEGSTTRDDIEISTPETFATKTTDDDDDAAKAAGVISDGSAFTLDAERTATDVARAIAEAGEQDEVETEEEKEDDDDEEVEHKQEENDAPQLMTATTAPAAVAPAADTAFVSPRATRRNTLSPSKASLLFNNSDTSIIDDSTISRRDTVSPAALKSLLQSITLNDESPTAQRARKEKSIAAAAGTDTASSDSDSAQDYIREMVTTNQFLASSTSATALQTPESTRKTRAAKRKEREERTLSPSEAMSMTLSDLAPRRSSAQKSKSPAKRSLLSPESSGTETLQEDTQEDDDDDNNTPSRQLRSHQKKNRRSTLEPTDAVDFLSALREEMQIDSDKEDAEQDAQVQDKGKSKRKQTIQTPHFDIDVSPVTRSRSRRATVDPSDIFTIASDARGRSRDDDEGKQTRRETLNMEDLYEINPELRSAHQEESDANSDRRDSLSRKRKQDQPDSDKSTRSPAGKKARGDDDSQTESPPQDSIVSMKSKVAAGLARPQKSPTPRKQPRGVTDSDQDGEEESSSTRQSLRGNGSNRQSIVAKFTSPPPVHRSSNMKTPLKSILSAKKPKAGPITTPTKSVNFGPPQGAEFNLGSPSTSMTPMLAKDARRMFPLDSSPPSLQEVDEEEEDEETSLNTSLLDEADAIDSDDAEQKEEHDEEDTTEMAISRLSFSINKSPDKNRRRYSLRGVSPLDNQANARRLRRNSVSAVVRSPVSARKLKGIGPGALSSQPAPPSASKSSFLANNDPEPQGRMAYADSSASSDAGEDMEITGDFSAFVQAGGNAFASNSVSAQKASATSPSFRFRDLSQEEKESSPFGDSPVTDETVELGSLGDLVAESAAYDDAPQSRAQQSTSQKSSSFVQGEDDSSAPVLGSLTDLAREGEENSPRARRLSSNTVRRFNSLHYSQLDDQDITLDPIMEEEEDATNSSAPSMMDIETSEDESDAEYDERRKSLIVNLSSKFERVGSGTPKSRTAPESEVTAADLGARIRSPLRQSPRRKSMAPAPPTVPLISMDELLITADLQNKAPTTPEGHFNELYSQSAAADSTVDSVKRASISNACKDVVKWHIDEISSWSAGLTDVLGSLLSEKAPALFSPEVLDESSVEAIKALHELETARVQSGLCQWRTKMESEIGEKLQVTAGELDKDVRTLKRRIVKDTATRQSELAALQELIDREKQMAELLDAIEEQQSVRNEYAATVDVLDTQCASLSLEASVLEDQLRVVENLAADSNLVSAETASELERQVLNVEEISAIQGSLSIWRVGVATSSHLKLSAQFDDVVLRVDLQVDVVLNDSHSASSSSSGSGFSTDVASNVTVKRRRRSSYLSEIDTDIVRLVQQKLFDPVQLSRFIRTSSSAQNEEQRRMDRPQRICALLQELERYVTLSYRFLRELRALSAQYAVEFIAEESVLWVEFLNFTPFQEAKFVVGFAILDEFPFSNFETSVHVVYGPVSPDDIRVEIDAEAAKQSEYEYISRICERLRNAFVIR